MTQTEQMTSILEGLKGKITVVDSFDKVTGDSIVFTQTEGEEEFELYICSIQEGKLGEYVSWVYAEFEEEEELLPLVHAFLNDLATGASFEEHFIKKDSPIHFTAY